MNDAETFSDEMLTAYLDGAADVATSQAIEAALETNAALADRLAALDIPMDALRQDFDTLLASAPSMPDLPAAAPAPVVHRSAFGGWAVAAAVVLAFGLGGIGGYQLKEDPPKQGWMAAAASYQALYTKTTLSIATPDDAHAAAMLQDVSAAVGRDLTAAVNVDGLTFKRAQILGFKGRPLIQIAYVDGAGQPFALCVIAMSDAADQGTQVQQFSGLSAAHWKQGGYGFVLIGGTQNTAVENWAEELQTEI